MQAPAEPQRQVGVLLGVQFFVKLATEHPAVYANLLGKLIPRTPTRQLDRTRP